ncbi:hypothetical protein E4T39_07561 [Aureobasidium subglaciale]|nr:hypothetical protein E4T39_07561 [Aureobasidium subglaciale]
MVYFRRFQWSFAKQHPEGSYFDRMNVDEAGRLNSFGTLAIVQKEPHGAVLDVVLEWEDEQTTYAVVRPHRSAEGYQLASRRGTAPSSQHVKVAASDDQLGLINWGQLQGVFAGGEIIRIREAEELTGAIPVIDTNEPTKQHIYYLPAVVPPLAMNKMYFERQPSFVVMKPGEMPSYVFWRRLEEYRPSLSEEDHLAATTAASSAELLVNAPVETPIEASVSEQPLHGFRTRRSRAPTPEERSTALVVDTEKAAEAPKENTKEIEPVWEVFYPQLEQDPIEFLDYYNTPLHGWHGHRSKMMLREEDIDRVNYISPCLAHNHQHTGKSAAVETVEVTGKSAVVEVVEDTAMDIDSLEVPHPEISVDATSAVSKPSEASISKPWVQPGPIADDDPAWKAFRDRLDRNARLRKARIRPEPVFTTKYCNAPGAKVDPKKVVLTREMYDRHYARAVKAQREIDARSKCCLACGLKWSECPETRYEHYSMHRHERKLYFERCQQQKTHSEPETCVEKLDPAKVEHLNKNVPGLNWFTKLEEVVLNLENELLEREQTCRVCDAHIDFGESSIAEHYNEHTLERKRLRTVPAFTDPVLSPKLVISTDGSAQIVTPEDSPPARSYRGLEPDHYLLRRDDEEKARRKELAELGDTVMAIGKSLKVDGTIPRAYRTPPTTKPSSSRHQSSPSNIMELTGDGPIHSDIVGKSTARRAFSPLRVPRSNSPTIDKGNVDFLSKHGQPSVHAVETTVRESSQSSAKESLDAARILADGSAHGVLRKLNLDLQQAFDTLVMTNELIEGVLEAPDIDTNGLSHSQWIQDLIFDHLRDITKKIGRGGSKKTVKDDGSFSNTSVNDLCSSIEPYDLWRILDKARVAFEELAEHPRAQSPRARRFQILDILRGVLHDAYLHGYDDAKRFPIEFFVPLKHDGLDMTSEDLNITEVLEEALESGHAIDPIKRIYRTAWETCVTLVRAHRAAPGHEAPEVARQRILKEVNKFVGNELERDRLLIPNYSTGASAKTRESQAPITISSSSSSESWSNNSLKRKRLVQLPTPTSQRKRKSTVNTDPEWEPATPSPFNVDEVSPRLPKAPRRSSDPLYRPGSALHDPTSPPPTPKRTTAQKAADRAARKKEKRKEKRALKTADKKEKKIEKSRKVTFDLKPAFMSKPPSPERSKSPTPIKGLVRKTTKSVVEKEITPAKVTKSKAVAKKATTVEPEAGTGGRPQRKAAVEAKKNFGKTKIIG